MIDPAIPAYIFTAFTAIVIAFQLALALGAPWGEMAMGGKYPRRFPLHMRIAALFQIVLLGVIALIVLTKAEVMLPEWYGVSQTAVWFVVAFFVIGTVLNVITPSKKERRLWAPVNIVMLLCVLAVAQS